MSRALVAVAATLLTFLVLDAIWISQVALPMFKEQLGPLLRDTPNVGAAVSFYAIYALGMLGLVVLPALHNGSMAEVAGRGALLGLTAYATFDLTNLAVLAPWSWSIAWPDMAWGTFVTAASCVAGFWAGRRLAREAPQ